MQLFRLQSVRLDTGRCLRVCNTFYSLSIRIWTNTASMANDSESNRLCSPKIRNPNIAAGSCIACDACPVTIWSTCPKTIWKWMSERMDGLRGVIINAMWSCQILSNGLNTRTPQHNSHALLSTLCLSLSPSLVSMMPLSASILNSRTCARFDICTHAYWMLLNAT